LELLTFSASPIYKIQLSEGANQQQQRQHLPADKQPVSPLFLQDMDTPYALTEPLTLDVLQAHLQ